MKIDSMQNHSVPGISAGSAGVGTGFAVNTGKSTGGDRTTVANSEPAKTTPGAAARSDPEVDRVVQEQIEQKDIVRLNDYVQNIRRRLEFRVDETTNRTVVTVVDQDSGEVIRQIPSEVALRLVQRLSNLQELSGILLDDQA